MVLVPPYWPLAATRVTRLFGPGLLDLLGDLFSPLLRSSSEVSALDEDDSLEAKRVRFVSACIPALEGAAAAVNGADPGGGLVAVGLTTPCSAEAAAEAAVAAEEDMGIGRDLRAEDACAVCVWRKLVTVSIALAKRN